ncbi:MAG: hypothetical protein AAF806_05905 [Bacteroidota bacterium]
MISNHFIKTKSIFKTAIQGILAKKNSLLFDEAALPAYAHKNPLIDYLFWKRLSIVYHFIQRSYNQQIQLWDWSDGSFAVKRTSYLGK